MLKLTAKDIVGVIEMNPTPSKPNAEDWREENSVDLDTSRRLFEMTLAGVVSGFGLCGTTGEGASLTWEEKRGYISVAAETINGRGYLLAGATSLGTKETIRQMRELRNVGADGVFVGLPLWQTPTLENAVQFYADLAEAVPDCPIMIYANGGVFKFPFPTKFWEGVGQKGTTVVATKITYRSQDQAADIRAATDRVQFIPSKWRSATVWKQLGPLVKGLWSTEPCPEPYVALANSIRKGDANKVDAIFNEFELLPKREPPEGQGEFPMYNIQVERAVWNGGNYLKLGPPRPPYRDLPQYWVRSTAVYGQGLDELRKKYLAVKAQ